MQLTNEEKESLRRRAYACIQKLLKLEKENTQAAYNIRKDYDISVPLCEYVTKEWVDPNEETEGWIVDLELVLKEQEEEKEA